MRAASLLPAWDLQGKKPHVFPSSPDVKPEASYLALLISMLIKCQSPRENLKEPCCFLCSRGDGHGTMSTGSSVPSLKARPVFQSSPWNETLGRARPELRFPFDRQGLTKGEGQRNRQECSTCPKLGVVPTAGRVQTPTGSRQESQRVRFTDEETEASRLSLTQQ